jgi:hypothetical protein
MSGRLSVVWGDPKPGTTGGETRFRLIHPDGSSLPLDLPDDRIGAAMALAGQPVSLHGALTSVGAGSPRVAVDSMVAISSPDRPGASAVRRTLFLLLKFKGDSQEPHPASFYTALTNPLVPAAGSTIPTTLNGFFNKTSWGQLQWKADVGGLGGLKATGWLTLPYPKTHYANCGWGKTCADLTAIQNDGMALGAKAGIDYTVYDNINFVLNNDLDCCAWGGSVIVYNNQYFGATWEPPWGQETGTYAHEFGHAIGLPHSGWVYYAYDSPWDTMSGRTSASSLKCGTYYSDNYAATEAIYCNEPGSGYIAAHKDYLGWIPARNEVLIDKAETVTVALEADALPLGTRAKMIKICLKGAPCTGTSAHYLTVEARVNNLGTGSQYDNGLPGDGVIIHDFQAARAPIGAGNPCFFSSQSGWAVPIDATPGDWIGKPTCSAGGRTWPNYALGNAEFLPGKTYTSTAHHVSVSVLARSGSVYTVKVVRTE